MVNKDKEILRYIVNRAQVYCIWTLVVAKAGRGHIIDYCCCWSQSCQCWSMWRRHLHGRWRRGTWLGVARDH